MSDFTTSHSKNLFYQNEIVFKNIKDCIKEHAKKIPDKEALVFVSTDGGREGVTFATLYERSCAAASAFIHLGVKKKEVVAINLRTCPEWLYATFGAMIAGAIPVSVSFTYTDGSDLVALMQKLQCCPLLIMDPGIDNVNWKIVQLLLNEQSENGAVKTTKMPYLKYLLGVGFEGFSAPVKSFNDLLDGANSNVAFPDIDPDDTATMLQTSGSTGVPKLVVHTHATFLSVTGSDLSAMDSVYKFFSDRPFNWLGGFPFSVLTGQTRVTVSGFCEPPNDRTAFMIDVVTKERCTLIGALPQMISELIRLQDDLPPVWPVQMIGTGGQPMTRH